MADSQRIAAGVVHNVPWDLQEALLSDLGTLTKWNNLTPLARNEWICWTISVKKDETRKEHVQRTVSKVKEGARRPCCWRGCTHRTDKPISASVQHILSKQRKSK